MRPILLATDFSPSAEHALSVAASFAQQLGAEVLVLHVDALPERAPLTPGARGRRERARAELDRSRQLLAERGVSARAYLRPGDPAREVLRVAAAHGVAAIILGTCGGAAREASLLGSVADRIVRDARLPIVIVPEWARGREAGAPMP